MPSLPTELLLQIFEKLPLHSLHQCLAVCKLWHYAARPFIDSTLNNPVGVDSLYSLSQVISKDPTKGLSIRSLSLPFPQDRRTTKSLYINILKGCPNIVLIDVHHIDSIFFLRDMLQEEVRLPKLEAIRTPSQELLPQFGISYLDLYYVYRESLTELALHLSENTRSQYAYFENTFTYLLALKKLKYLCISSNFPIAFGDIIMACPQLQILKLDVNISRFEVPECQIAIGHRESRLETLVINSTLFTSKLCAYLRDYCKQIFELSLSGPFDSIASLIASPYESNRHQALPITHLTLHYQLPLTPLILDRLADWFPRLHSVEFKSPDMNSIKSDHGNVHMDFAGLQLRYISIDLSPWFYHARTISLKLISGSETVYYHRVGKGRSRNLFELKQSKYYTNQKLAEKREASDSTAIITLKTASIDTIRLYSGHYNSRLDQFIRL